jgi:hypothetical protein
LKAKENADGCKLYEEALREETIAKENLKKAITELDE